jgi:hypothetical protein
MQSKSSVTLKDVKMSLSLKLFLYVQAMNQEYDIILEINVSSVAYTLCRLQKKH